VIHRRNGRATDSLAALSRSRVWAERCEGAATPVLRMADAPPSLDVLTSREREIAELAARGHTNQQIADLLVLSRRTVGNHLSHAYMKLGVSSRQHLALLLGLSTP
jgi:DNA-binding CsgD family transcriptional regulator